MKASALVQSFHEHGLATREDLQELVQRTGNDDYLIAEALFEQSRLAEDRLKIGKLYGDSINTAYIHLEKTLFQDSALAKLEKEFAASMQCLPVYIFGDVMTVAVSKPRDASLIAKIEKLTGMSISPVFAFTAEILNGIEIQYGSSSEIEKLSGSVVTHGLDAGSLDPDVLKQLSQSSGVIKIVMGMLLLCLKHGASDIHVQPMAKKISVRYRIDGMLRELIELNLTSLPAVVSRLKVLAKLNITERRLPQDGRLELELKGRKFSFRLSTVPTVFGEKAVIRSLGNTLDTVITPMEDLGLSTSNKALLDRLLHSPNGILFVTGPTGSGKTTTLYSMLGAIQRPELNIATVEDPVEITLNGITQIQANSAIGLDFAKVLRAVLRQDPDVILIGEIRDLETAKIASEAALTGHFVMTTMHTNDSLQAVTRLIEIGVEPFLVAPSVIGVVAQRLVRKICDSCKESYQPSDELMDSLFYNRGDSAVQFYRGKGCNECNNSGYAKRIAIHEIFIVNDVIRDLISSKASTLEIERESRKLGFKTLRYDGVLKVLQGLTTIDEVNRVTAEVVF